MWVIELWCSAVMEFLPTDANIWTFQFAILMGLLSNEKKVVHIGKFDLNFSILDYSDLIWIDLMTLIRNASTEQ